MSPESNRIGRERRRYARGQSGNTQRGRRVESVPGW